MKFNLNKGPFIRNKRSTTGIMLELFATLMVVWIAAITYYWINFTYKAGLRVILIGVISLVTTLLVDIVMALICKKRTIKDIAKYVLKNYSYVTALIFALCLPAGTDFFVVAIGALVATALGKCVFGGFGNNIFNPAILGRILVGLSFSDKLKPVEVLANGDIDVSSSATITSTINWQSADAVSHLNLTDTLFGHYQGAIGETFTVLLVIIAIYLIIRGIVNFRLILGYLVTATLCLLGLGLVNHADNLATYILMGLSTGGIMFAGTFMITDPVTSPKSQEGKIIYSSIAGFLAIFIRSFSSYPEGVMFSIALGNMITPLIDSTIKGNTLEHVGRRTIKLVAWPIVASAIVTGYSCIPFGSSNESSELKAESTYAVTTVSQVNKTTDSFYNARESAEKGVIGLNIRIDRLNRKITEVKIVEKNDDEPEVESNISAFIGSGLRIDYEALDQYLCQETCSNEGTNYNKTSSAVIKAIKNTISKVKNETTLSYEVVSGKYIVSGEGNHGLMKIEFNVDKTNKMVLDATIVSTSCDSDGCENHENGGAAAIPTYFNKWIGTGVNMSFETVDLFTKPKKTYVYTGEDKKQNVVDGTNGFDVTTGSTYTRNAIIDIYKQLVDIIRAEVSE